MILWRPHTVIKACYGKIKFASMDPKSQTPVAFAPRSSGFVVWSGYVCQNLIKSWPNVWHVWKNYLADTLCLWFAGELFTRSSAGQPHMFCFAMFVLTVCFTWWGQKELFPDYYTCRCTLLHGRIRGVLIVEILGGKISQLLQDCSRPNSLEIC